jgi:hypothetical protein
MWPHPQCTKETRTSNQKNQERQLFQHSLPGAPVMGYIPNQGGMFESVPNRNQPNHQNPSSFEQYLKMSSSSTNQPLSYHHDHYMMDPYAQHIRNQQGGGQQMIDRIQQNTRDIGKMKYNEPVQKNFQQDYFMMNYETLNNVNRGVPMIDRDGHDFSNRNPTSEQRDMMEKTRNRDRNHFMAHQGGNLMNFVDLNPQYTRKERNNVNTGSYIPMARTMAIPKDKI